MQKKKVGIFSLTCDEGCSIYMIEVFNKKLLGWLEKMEIKYFLSIKERVEIKDFDICLVEGIVTTERDKADIEKIRANTKVLIAMGTCAMTSQPSGMRNNFNDTQFQNIKERLVKFKFLPRAYPLKDIVRVDDEIPGCPINEEKFIEVFEKYLDA
jgi:coenzyme F420-reducing hydrogenase gamma subunit